MSRPLKFTPGELQKKIDEFWEFIKETERPATLERLNCFLQCDKELLNEYESRPEYEAIVKKVKREIYADKVERLIAGRNPVGVIFDLKNNYNWVDKQDINVGTKHVLFVGEDKILD